MVLQTHLRPIYQHRLDLNSGKILSSVPTSLHSDGTPMVLKHMEATLHQRLYFGRDQVRWVKDIQPLHLSGEIMVSQYLVELSNNHLEIAGSLHQHQLLQNNQSESIDLFITKNTIKMVPLDSISG